VPRPSRRACDATLAQVGGSQAPRRHWSSRRSVGRRRHVGTGARGSQAPPTLELVQVGITFQIARMYTNAHTNACAATPTHARRNTKHPATPRWRVGPPQCSSVAPPCVPQCAQPAPTPRQRTPTPRQTPRHGDVLAPAMHGACRSAPCRHAAQCAMESCAATKSCAAPPSAACARLAVCTAAVCGPCVVRHTGVSVVLGLHPAWCRGCTCAGCDGAGSFFGRSAGPCSCLGLAMDDGVFIITI